jgi:excisionase family DNA binding protein
MSPGRRGVGQLLGALADPAISKARLSPLRIAAVSGYWLGVADDDEYLLVAEVAALCRTPTSSVREWIRTGRLAATRPGRRVLVRRSDVEALLAASRRTR